jgi:hypothetical protein
MAITDRPAGLASDAVAFDTVRNLIRAIRETADAPDGRDKVRGHPCTV